ncbi:MAG: TRAP transporter large permease subunit [Alphaproteobacteria bacterium]|nr:TRAP transporter large permease subunit [Alphaproteobacteria bacterium]
MWFVLGLTALAIVFYSREKLPLEVTSVALLTCLLLFGQFFPVVDANGRNLMDASALLAGFANPALVAVLALLVMGQGVIQTDALRPLIRLFERGDPRHAWLSIAGVLLFVMVFSAFLNNTPLVVIAIPIVQALAARAGRSESRLMIPLSYVAILGGMMTLIGSSTNLLVSNVLLEIGYERLEFFQFTVPGSILAGVGLVYTLVVVPRMLPDRSSLARQLMGDEREFIAELDVAPDSKLVGMECREGHFPDMPDLSIRLIQRSGHLILPPFEGYEIEAGDILIIAATRTTLTDLLSKYPGFLIADTDEGNVERRKAEILGDDGGGKTPDLEQKVAETRVLAEIMITPASRLVDMSLDQAGFHRQFGVIVLGIQRRARVVRRRLGRIRLEPGDVLLVSGSLGSVESLRNNPDMIVLSGSKKELKLPKKAPVAAAIFLLTVLLASSGVLSIAVAAITGAVLMIATGCLNIRQATRAIDRKIFLLVGAMLALGTAMQVSGGAQYIADRMLEVPFTDEPLFLAGFLFIVVAIMTNILSNNACAILFTPIAVNMAVNVNVDPYVFAILVIFAANCSFASPIGYKTNLLVMGPGHYRFMDFMKAGVPLVGVVWVTYILLAKFYYGL